MTRDVVLFGSYAQDSPVSRCRMTMWSNNKYQQTNQ
jgi:hypothetical protein